jgi:hypothetical protein
MQGLLVLIDRFGGEDLRSDRTVMLAICRRNGEFRCKNDAKKTGDLQVGTAGNSKADFNEYDYWNAHWTGDVIG